MKKSIFTGTFLILVIMIINGQLEVDRDELSKATDSIEFINYLGPYDYINTFEEIRGIGVFIGRRMSENPLKATYYGLYSVLHVYDPLDTSGKLDADIFVIEKDAAIDHIRNVRTVIAGYLQVAYGYSLKDALLIARFVTIYNAVFRGDIDYFKTVYKSKVMEYLSKEDAGIATVYSEWPGKTKALIPLREGFEKGKLSSLDTQKLTEEKVKEELRKKEDMGLPERKEMVELQERQLEEQEKEIKKEKELLDEEKWKLEEEKAILEEEKEKTGETEATRQKEEEIKRKEESIKREEEDLQRREERTKESQKQIQKDREGIARDERSKQEKKETTATTRVAEDTITDRGLFLKVAGGNENESGELVLFDFGENNVSARSENIKIKTRRLLILGNSILVVAEPSSGQNYLMLINPRTLKKSAQSEQPVFGQTVFTTQGNSAYAVIMEGNKYYLGRFSASLELQYKSVEEVNPFTPITVSGAFLYVQDKNGTVLRLSVTDLSRKGTANVR